MDRGQRRRLALSALMVGLPLLVLLMDTGVRCLRGWRPPAGVDRIAAVVLGLLTLAWWGALLFPRTRRGLARRWAPATISAVLVASAVVSLQLAISDAPFHLRRPGLREVFHPDPRYLPGVAGDGRLTVNEVGIRGDPLPARDSAYRVLCVGGSTTECLYLDDRETWPRLLQDELAARLGRPAWVGNVGISGYSTTEHIAFLECFELLGEMDCVLVMAGINDLGLLTLGKRRPILAPRQAPVWARTKALRLARSLEGSLRGTPFQDPLGRWIEERRELRRRAPKVPALPDLARGREEFEARLVRIAEICSGRGVRLALATQAVLWRSDLDAAAESLLWIGWVPDKSAFYEAGALRGGMDAFNAGAASVAARRGLTLIDVAAISGDRRWFYDDCHFTEAGARRVAELVAAGLPAPRP